LEAARVLGTAVIHMRTEIQGNGDRSWAGNIFNDWWFWMSPGITRSHWNRKIGEPQGGALIRLKQSASRISTAQEGRSSGGAMRSTHTLLE